MNQERFGQFLRTAMINKLDRGGAIIIDIEEAPPQPEPRTDIRKKTAEKEPSLQNYFSETAFEKQRKESIATALSEERSHQDISPDPEYTDTKTGHIYIQGDQKKLRLSHRVSPNIRVASLLQPKGRRRDRKDPPDYLVCLR
jgi:hypothetical protein